MLWIIGGDQREYGPITNEQLRQWMREDRVNEHTLIRTKAGDQWRPLSDFPHLRFPGASAPAASHSEPTVKGFSCDPISAVIPYRNMPAVISYYLAVFSLIPCLGIPLGLAAVVLGAIGLKRAREQPECKGRVHAWTGIILGGLFGFGYLIALCLIWLRRSGGI